MWGRVWWGVEQVISCQTLILLHCIYTISHNRTLKYIVQVISKFFRNYTLYNEVGIPPSRNREHKAISIFVFHRSVYQFLKFGYISDSGMTIYSITFAYLMKFIRCMCAQIAGNNLQKLL